MSKTPEPFSREAGDYCYFVDETCLVKGEGYSPRLVFENIGGYLETGGGDTAPYRWGQQDNGTFSLEAAQAHCARVNARRGISPKRASEIVSGAIGRQIREERAGDHANP